MRAISIFDHGPFISGLGQWGTRCVSHLLPLVARTLDGLGDPVGFELVVPTVAQKCLCLRFAQTGIQRGSGIVPRQQQRLIVRTVDEEGTPAGRPFMLADHGNQAALLQDRFTVGGEVKDRLTPLFKSEHELPLDLGLAPFCPMRHQTEGHLFQHQLTFLLQQRCGLLGRADVVFRRERPPSAICAARAS